MREEVEIYPITYEWKCPNCGEYEQLDSDMHGYIICNECNKKYKVK